MSKDLNISPNEPCLTEVQLLALAQNRLPKHEAAALKRHTAHCEMCADALEGVRFMSDPDQLPTMVAAINNEVIARGAAKPKVVRFPSAGMIGIAASVCLLIGFFIFSGDTLNMQDTSMADEPEMTTQERADESDADKKQVTEEVKSSISETEQLKKNTQTAEKTVRKADEVQEKKEQKLAENRGNTAPAVEDDIAFEEESASTEPSIAEEETRESKSRSEQSPPLPEPENKEDASQAGMAVSDGFEESDKAFGNQRMVKAKDASMPLPAVSMEEYKHPNLSNKQNRLLKKAMQAFNLGKLKEAETLFGELLSESPQSRVVNYLAGINYLYLKEPLKARERLMVVAKRQGEVAFESVDWPNILQLLKNGNNEEAKRLLQTYTQREGLIRFR